MLMQLIIRSCQLHACETSGWSPAWTENLRMVHCRLTGFQHNVDFVYSDILIFGKTAHEVLAIIYCSCSVPALHCLTSVSACHRLTPKTKVSLGIMLQDGYES